jgi:predicted metal-binding membrane protein
VSNAVRNTDKGVVEHLAGKDRMIVILAVVAIVALAGVYTVTGVGMNMSALEMTTMANSPDMPMKIGQSMGWTAAYAILVALMWWIMMIAMMTPSAAPTLLLFAALKHHGKDKQDTAFHSGLLLAGYLLIWAVCSVIATFLQWGMETLGLISTAMMTINSKLFAGTIFLCAGLYQFSGLKNACLKHCRSPAYFLSENRRSGPYGAFMMGAHHGVYCLGCCWALMALLFVGGVMNLYWIVGLALYVLVEKTLPFGHVFSKAAGTLLITIGAYTIFSVLL